VSDEHPVVATVLAWSEAWNACDAERLAGMIHPDFRFQRLNGEVADAEGLADLVSKQSYGVAFKVEPRRLFGNGERYVAEVRAEFRYVENGELAGSADAAAMAFEMRDGAVSHVAPSTSLEEALERTGLTEDDWIADLGLT
jgi:ketosteroid isomerase-like protein